MNKDVATIKLCAKCGSTDNITRDHIIPRWIMVRIHMFGIKAALPEGWSNFQDLCESCNLIKGGKVDWENPIVREYMRQIAEGILSKLEKPLPASE